MGELGKDTGGVTREMWRLFGNELKMLCDGRKDKLVFRHDSAKVQVNLNCHMHTQTGSWSYLACYH